MRQPIHAAKRGRSTTHVSLRSGTLVCRSRFTRRNVVAARLPFLCDRVLGRATRFRAGQHHFVHERGRFNHPLGTCPIGCSSQARRTCGARHFDPVSFCRRGVGSAGRGRGIAGSGPAASNRDGDRAAAACNGSADGNFGIGRRADGHRPIADGLGSRVGECLTPRGKQCRGRKRHSAGECARSGGSAGCQPTQTPVIGGAFCPGQCCARWPSDAGRSQSRLSQPRATLRRDRRHAQRLRDDRGHSDLASPAARRA